MKKILITRKLIKDSEDKASKTFDPIFNSNDELYSQSKVIEMSKGCDGILTSLTDKMDKETIDKLPDTIKIISNFAVGFGNIDLEAAKKRGIAVTNTPEVLSDATAEIGILLILGACRRASEGIEAAREGGWKWSADYLIGKQLTGTRLGILGMGGIGQKIAKIAQSLGMIIGSHSQSHTLLSRLSYREQFKELKNSKIFLEKIIKKNIDTFCYPYGGKISYNDNTLKILKKLQVKFKKLKQWESN